MKVGLVKPGDLRDDLVALRRHAWALSLWRGSCPECDRPVAAADVAAAELLSRNYRADRPPRYAQHARCNDVERPREAQPAAGHRTPPGLDEIDKFGSRR